MKIDTLQYYLVGLLCSWMASVMIAGIIRQKKTGLIQNNTNESFLISALVMLVNFFICYVFIKISARQKGVFYQIDSIGNILIIKSLEDGSQLTVISSDIPYSGVSRSYLEKFLDETQSIKQVSEEM